MKTREELIAKLVKDGMPPDLAPRAVDAFDFLLDGSELLKDKCEGNPDLGFWLRYGFMQGFVAGAMASVHHN